MRRQCLFLVVLSLSFGCISIANGDGVVNTELPEDAEPVQPPASGPHVKEQKAAFQRQLRKESWCHSASDQLRNTCPKLNLKKERPRPGGPRPTRKGPGRARQRKLRRNEVQDAVEKGKAQRGSTGSDNDDVEYDGGKGKEMGRKLLQVTGDSWEIANDNIGVSPIHMGLSRYDRLIMLDRKFYDYEAHNPTGIEAIEYDVETDTVVQNVTILTNTWCSAGSTLPGGDILSFGGGTGSTYGGNAVRTYHSCNAGNCLFEEDTSPNPATHLLESRWYPTSVLAADGRVLIISGADNDYNTGSKGDSFEVWPRRSAADNNISYSKLPVDLRTIGYNTAGRDLYPHVHLLPNGDFFICTHNVWYAAKLEVGASLLTKGPGTIDPRWTDGGTPVTYPGAGASVMLPLEAPYTKATIVICGGTWAYFDVNGWVDPDCVVVSPTDSAPVASRTMLTMPNKRIIPMFSYLFDGTIALMGGGAQGSSGYYSATLPQLTADILDPATLTFKVGAAATKPRMYHAVALTLRSGAILTAGSNPQGGYYFQSDPATGVFPADLTTEIYYPWYFSVPRPELTLAGSGVPNVVRGSSITANIKLTGVGHTISAAIFIPGFSTHSLTFDQRYVKVPSACATPTVTLGVARTTCSITIPSSANVVPPSDYILIVLESGVPSEGIWISIGASTPSPTKSPTPSPTSSPTKSPTPSPTSSPTKSPTPSPTASPTKSPTRSPTPSPFATKSPTRSPTPSPLATKSPTRSPTPSPVATKSPTPSPTSSPTKPPTHSPTASPTPLPNLAAGTYTITNSAHTCSPYLSGTPCFAGNFVDTFVADDGSGRQRWVVTPISAGSNTYTLRLITGREGCNSYLSAYPCNLAPAVDIWGVDDGSSRQHWQLIPTGTPNQYRISSAGRSVQCVGAPTQLLTVNSCAASPQNTVYIGTTLDAPQQSWTFTLVPEAGR